MADGMRQWIDRLEAAGELVRAKREVDPRYISALLARAPGAALLEKVTGYDIGVVGGLASTRRRVAIGMGCADNDIGKKFQQGIEHPIPPVMVDDAPAFEVSLTGDQVDLTRLPIPVLHEKDGGPYLSSGVVVAKDPEFGRNAGVYRLMYRTPRTTSIDLVSHSDMRLFYSRRLERKEPLPIAIALGTHLNELMAAGYGAPMGMDEFAVAGGLHGRPVELVRCRTVDLEVPANAEIILEGEILPVGWTEDEGRFGDFTNLQCSLKWNPLVRYTAMSYRRDALLYALTMPWENDWLGAPSVEAMCWAALKTAGVKATALRVTPGGCCHFQVIAAIRKRAGEGKNALLALLALGIIKWAIVTDADIDISNQDELDWAVTFRVQPDRDIYILPGLRGKHLDPSLRAWELPKGELPTTAKFGIDATIPEGISREHYERPIPTYLDAVRIDDYF
jgi:2,5-furandicarboxylate decarboxylase 1